MKFFTDVYNCGGRGVDQNDPVLKAIKLFFMLMEEEIKFDDLKRFLNESPEVRNSKINEIAAIIKR